jgi:hypothetical protein
MPAKPSGTTFSVATNQSSAAEAGSGLRQLRARARLYRRLAETLYDPQIIDVVLACATECETEAGALTSDEAKKR